MTESASRRVEGHGKVAWFFFLDEFENIFCESEKDGHVGTLRVYHRMPQECVVHFENQRMAVHQKQFFLHYSLYNIAPQI